MSKRLQRGQMLGDIPGLDPGTKHDERVGFGRLTTPVKG